MVYCLKEVGRRWELMGGQDNIDNIIIIERVKRVKCFETLLRFLISDFTLNIPKPTVRSIDDQSTINSFMSFIENADLLRLK